MGTSPKRIVSSAENARGGVINLRRPWQRIVFAVGLALPGLVLIALLVAR